MSPSVPILAIACVPLTYLIAGAATFPGVNTLRVWLLAEISAILAIAVTLMSLGISIWLWSFEGTFIDAPVLLMSALVSLIGWVIIRYSKRYLNGEPGQPRYVRTMLLTLASVSVVVSTDHLGILALAWSVSSIALHNLLTFYRHRPAAVIVAHKKFIVSRLAELCLVIALYLIYREFDTLFLHDISERMAGTYTPSTSLRVAMIFIVLAVILKSALLPFHGWLIQVMEAPTPVSALLHAGIVNLGGFVLIRLAVFLSVVPEAQVLLGVIGSLSAVMAGLVMMTRISIKVRLAWSTCAQMGFMLLECSLGLYDLAFLHLIAHSAYKAYAFLSAGEAVAEARRFDLLPALQVRSSVWEVVRCVAAVPIALILVTACIAGVRTVGGDANIPAVEILIVSLGLASTCWPNEDSFYDALRALATIIFLSLLFIGWHWVFGRIVPTATGHGLLGLQLWSGTCFTVLYLLQVWLRVFPNGNLARNLYPWAYAGFYLDERFTRLTFSIWPARTHIKGSERIAFPVIAGRGKS